MTDYRSRDMFQLTGRGRCYLIDVDEQGVAVGQLIKIDGLPFTVMAIEDLMDTGHVARQQDRFRGCRVGVVVKKVP